jgi:hypothetical protein
VCALRAVCAQYARGRVGPSPAAGPRFTAGSVYCYPGFAGAAAADSTQFASDYARFIARPYGLEAVMRVRASKGACGRSRSPSLCAWRARNDGWPRAAWCTRAPFFP